MRDHLVETQKEVLGTVARLFLLASCVGQSGCRYNQEGTTKAHVGNPHYGSEAYQQLNLHPEILRVVSGMLMGCPRLMHSVATRMVKTPDTEPPGFHRDTDGFVFPLGFRNPHNDYQAAGGELYCSHISTWVSLCEVPEGTGFCVVPGSHQSHFEAPAGLPAIHVRRSPLRPACSAVQAVHSDERALLLPLWLAGAREQGRQRPDSVGEAPPRRR